MHHLGTGPARDVEVLKGVNMAFRAEALALPTSGLLRGSGAQVDFEVITCAWTSERGWRIVYDPAVQVDHEIAVRHGSDQRQRPSPSAVFDAAFNSVVAASAMGGTAVLRHAGYGVVVGTSDRPGVVRAAVAVPRGEREVLRRAAPALAGRVTALLWLCKRWLTGATPLVVTAPELRRTARVRRSGIRQRATGHGESSRRSTG